VALVVLLVVTFCAALWIVIWALADIAANTRVITAAELEETLDEIRTVSLFLEAKQELERQADEDAEGNKRKGS